MASDDSDRSRARHNAIIQAALAVDAAKHMGDPAAVALAENALNALVIHANDNGLSWQAIGDALGVRRGTAYQRFRRRPENEDSRE